MSNSPNQLPRVLGPWMAMAIVVGTVIGSGVFKKPEAVSKAIPEVGLALAAWVLVGMLAVIGSLVLAEVAMQWPRAGGNYAFLREGYGRWAGFLWGWVEFWIIRSASIAALATIFTESLHDLLRQARNLAMDQELLSFWSRQGMTVAVIGVLALVNARGTRWGGGLQVAITSVKVGSLLTIALLPFIVAGLTGDPVVRPEPSRASILWPAAWGQVDWSQFGAGLVGILWAYHGWMNLAPVVSEVRNPHRNIPLAFIGGTMAVIVLYVSVNIAYYLVMSPQEMADLGSRAVPRTVAAEFASRLVGPVGLALASAAVMISVFGALNGNLLVGPRLLYAMGQDNLAPRFLSGLHARYQTPAVATLVLAAWSIALVVGASLLVALDLPLLKKINVFDLLTNYAIFGATSFETLAVATIFPLRRRFPPSEVNLPYRCRLYPLLPVIYVLVMGLVLANMFVTGPTESLVAVGFIALGAVVYFVVYREIGL